MPFAIPARRLPVLPRRTQAVSVYGSGPTASEEEPFGRTHVLGKLIKEVVGHSILDSESLRAMAKMGGIALCFMPLVFPDATRIGVPLGSQECAQFGEAEFEL